MKYLFLGGTADGQRLETDGREHWSVPRRQELFSTRIDKVDVTAFTALEVDEYARCRFTDRDGTEFVVYYYTDDNLKPLARLIAGYNAIK